MNKYKSYLIFPKAIEQFKLKWPSNGFDEALHTIRFELDAGDNLVDIEFQDYDTNPLDDEAYDDYAVGALIEDAIIYGLNVGENRFNRFYVFNRYHLEGKG